MKICKGCRRALEFAARLALPLGTDSAQRLFVWMPCALCGRRWFAGIEAKPK